MPTLPANQYALYGMHFPFEYTIGAAPDLRIGLSKEQFGKILYRVKEFKATFSGTISSERIIDFFGEERRITLEASVSSEIVTLARFDSGENERSIVEALAQPAGGRFWSGTKRSGTFTYTVVRTSDETTIEEVTGDCRLFASVSLYPTGLEASDTYFSEGQFFTGLNLSALMEAEQSDSVYGSIGVLSPYTGEPVRGSLVFDSANISSISGMAEEDEGTTSSLDVVIEPANFYPFADNSNLNPRWDASTGEKIGDW